MPKIPVVGRQVELAAGSLGPRASSSAFEAPAVALTNLAKEAGNVAYQFGMAEQKREDSRIMREEFAKAFDETSNAVFADTSTNVNDADANFEAVKNKIIQDIDGKGYSKRRAELVKGGLEKLFLQKKFDAKQEANKRGLMQTAIASDKMYSSELETLKTLPPNSALFNFKADALRQLVESDAKSGIPTKYNPVNIENQISAIAEDNTRKGVQDRIKNATSQEALDALDKEVSKLNISASAQSVLTGQIKARETEIQSEQVARFSQAIPIENVGDTDFDTVEAVEEKIEDARNGKFADPALAKEWETLGPEERNRIESAWQARLQAARSTADYKRKAAERAEEDANEELYVDGKNMVLQGSATAIEKIREMDFVGVKGETYREQLIDLAGRRARGEILTDSKPAVFRETQQKIFKGEIKDVVQKFVLTTDTPEVRAAGGLSLLERQGSDLSDDDVSGFERYLKAEARVADSDENAARVRNDKSFNDFVDAYKDKIIGNPAFAKLNLNSDSRFYDFSVQMKKRFDEQIEAGVSPRELLDPRSPKFIIRPDENWTPSAPELMQEIADSLKATNEIPDRQQFAPPPRGNMSAAEYFASDAYKQWATGPNKPKWDALGR